MEEKKQKLSWEARSKLRHTHSKKSIDELLRAWPVRQKWGKWLRREIVSQTCKLFQQVRLVSSIDKDFQAELKRFGIDKSLQLIIKALGKGNPYGGSTRTSSGPVSGNSGARLFDATHNDIDESEIDIVCRTGGMRVQLRERIWYEWSTRWERTSDAGGEIHETVEIDSDCYDGDQRLIVRATANGTRGDVIFRSTDR